MIVVIGRLDPEVLLSLLRKIKRLDYTANKLVTEIKIMCGISDTVTDCVGSVWASGDLKPHLFFKQGEPLALVYQALVAIKIVAVLMPARVSSSEPNRCSAAVPKPRA